MINFENEEGKKIFNIRVLQILLAIVISVILTYAIINFIPFSDMLDSFKVSFKTCTIDKIVKYYSFTLAIIVIPIYTVLYFGVHEIIKLIYEKVILKNKED